MHEVNFFRLFTDPLNDLGIPYMVTGSVASILYGEPRLTHDIDLILALQKKDLQRFCAAFPFSNFYCPPTEVIQDELARSSRGHFNIIHHQSGFKCDVYLLGNDPLHHWALANKRTVTLDRSTLTIAPPEYVIIRKLAFFKEGRSEKHLRDIRSIIDVLDADLDLAWLVNAVQEQGLSTEWALVCPD